SLLSPNGGENWNEESRHRITWNPGFDVNINHVQILYSIDNGQSYSVIYDSVGNTGNRLWTISRTPSDEALVKIIAYDTVSNILIEDVSDAVFTIQDVETYVHTTDEISHTIRNDGKSGTFIYPVPAEEPSLEFPVGSGNHHLYMSNFLVATINDNGDTLASMIYTADNFMPTSQIDVTDQGNYIETYTRYLDKLELGLEIDERTIVFKNSSFIIFLYEIYNDTNINYPEFYVGIFNDFDLRDPQQNRTGYDHTNRLAYIYDNEGIWTSYAGIRLLNNDPHAFRRTSGLLGNDPSTTGDVYRLLATPGIDDPSGDTAGDYRVWESFGPINLSAYSLVKIPFVLAVGNGLDELLAVSQLAQNIWIEPDVATNNAEDFTPVFATLKATVNTHGFNSEVYFEYGKTTEYGNTIAAEQSPVSNNGPVSVSAKITGLEDGTTYHFKAVAANFIEEVYGEDRTFSTPEYPGNFPVQLSYQFPSYSSPSDYSTQDYRIVGLPGNSVQLISSYLNGTQGQQWQVYWDNGTDNDYQVKYNGNDIFRCIAGKAFWVINMGDFNINTTVVSANLNSTTATVRIQLHNGFNLITNPYNFDMDWTLVKNYNGIDENLWPFNGEFNSTTTNFRTGVGYYFDNIDNLSSIEIPYPTDLAKGVSSKFSKKQTNDFIWKIKAELHSGEFTDKTTVLGIAADAKKDLDKYDQRKPRNIGNVPSIFFNRPQWIDSYPVFAVDIRPEFEEVEYWDFNIYSEERNKIKLTFLDFEDVPEDFEIYLIDKNYAKYVNLREENFYEFNPVKSISDFQLIVGSDEEIEQALQNLIPTTFHVGQNYPNPFNPITTIPIEIPVQTEIIVQIYNLLGQELHTLYKGELPAGRHFFNWDGTSKSGKKVPSGVYIYSIKIKSGQRYSGKMILMK
ncbi:MAG: T9SS type A sorting domain-containing protein, partial [Calditrichia bacterium]|nr:T9SS type A sorting domain-containing protein [Calditrichia bacterium]